MKMPENCRRAMSSKAEATTLLKRLPERVFHFGGNQQKEGKKSERSFRRTLRRKISFQDDSNEQIYG